MSREEAENFAKKVGLFLETTPRVEDFDPMQEMMWSLSMAVTWIVWRNPQRVREAWGEFRSKCVRWRKNDLLNQQTYIDFELDEEESRTRPSDLPAWPILDGGLDLPSSGSSLQSQRQRRDHGWTLAPMGPLSLLDLEDEWQSLKLEASSQRSMTAEAARNELWSKLSSAELIGTAICIDTYNVCELSPNEWPFLEICPHSPDGENTLRHRGDKERYRSVVFARCNLMEIWPEFGLDLEHQSASPLEASRQAPTETCPHVRKRYSWKREKIEKYILEVYPGGVPGTGELTNADLVRKIQKKMKGEKFVPSLESVLRAAGRRFLCTKRCLNVQLCKLVVAQ